MSTSDHAIISYTVSVGIDDLLLDSCTFAEKCNEYTRWNVSKANWNKYTKLADAVIHNIVDLESVHAINDTKESNDTMHKTICRKGYIQKHQYKLQNTRNTNSNTSQAATATRGQLQKA